MCFAGYGLPKLVILDRDRSTSLKSRLKIRHSAFCLLDASATPGHASAKTVPSDAEPEIETMQVPS